MISSPVQHACLLKFAKDFPQKEKVVVEARPYRWRLSGSFLAHLLKATTKQHHHALAPMIGRMVPSTAIVLDAGAHAGQYTKLFARAARNGRVYAFEPGSYARSILRVVVWLHGLSNVTVLPMALGCEAGLETLTIPLKHESSFGFGLSHLGEPQRRWPAVEQELVAVTTIDRMVDVLGLDRVDFIKADIEGWEMKLLLGADTTLERFRPRLLLELTSAGLARTGGELDHVFAYLEGRGYRAFRFEPCTGLVPIKGPGDGDFWFIPVADPLIDRIALQQC